jgi:hypothetical protein
MLLSEAMVPSIATWARSVAVAMASVIGLE